MKSFDEAASESLTVSRPLLRATLVVGPEQLVFTRAVADAVSR